MQNACVCYGAEAGEEFKVILHIFMSCLGLKVKNSLLIELKQLRAKMCLQLLPCILMSSPPSRYDKLKISSVASAEFWT